MRLIELMEENDRMREALEWIAERRPIIHIDVDDGDDVDHIYVAEYILDELHEMRKRG